LAYYNRGLDRLGQGRLDEAAADSAAAARLRPSFGWAEYHWGLALYCQCRWEEARTHFHAAADTDASLAYPHYCLAMLGTRDHFHAGLALLAPAPLNVAPVGLLQETATDTRRQFDETLRTAPDFPDTYFELGKFLLCLGERSQAVAYLEQSLRLRPDNVGYRATLEAARR
jgi:tetratricopeptide (TPR) repeat protein